MSGSDRRSANWVLWCGVPLLAGLHQDFWNWDDGRLLFGFLPVGLAYHAGYSLLAASFWAFVVAWCWPSRLEEWAGAVESEVPPRTEGTGGREDAKGGGA